MNACLHFYAHLEVKSQHFSQKMQKQKTKKTHKKQETKHTAFVQHTFGYVLWFSI